ncbi:MAG: HAD family hydrolase [Patescibacteria group bacterium]
MRYHQLVLFDIDGTLIYHVGGGPVGLQRFAYSLGRVYGVPGDFNPSEYNGMIDRQMAWNIVSRHGVSRKTFLEKFPSYIAGMLEYLQEGAKKEKLYEPIRDAVALVKELRKHPHVALGIITGNAKRIADWKLDHAGIPHEYFQLGLYGGEADDRQALAKLVFEKANRVLGQPVAPADIVVVGDTVHDIRAGIAIGAKTIAVTTGLHGDRVILAKEKPDLLVDSLMEKSVRDFFGV